MPALVAGTTAPDFTLEAMDGKKFSLGEARKHGPVVAVFLKISCPVCQYALPFLERIHKSYPTKKAVIVGISQDDKASTAAFMREYGITFPVLLDDTRTYPASNAYGLTNVPSIFYIEQSGEIEISSVGWSRPDIEEINSKIAAIEKIPLTPVFRRGEEVSDFRAG